MFRFLPWDALDIIHAAFEHRLNCLDGEGVDETPASWKTLWVHCIAKVASAYKVKDWRPISLTAALQRWYMGCVVGLVRENAVLQCNLLGFEPGHQPMEITEFLRLLLQKCYEWNVPLIINCGDVHKAFDSMKHDFLDEAAELHGIPLVLRAAMVRELTDVGLHICLNGIVVENIPLQVGGKQGGTQTPLEWNLYLDSAIAPTIASWLQSGLGFKFLPFGNDSCPQIFENETTLINHAVWADDVYLLSTSWEMSRKMLTELTAALHRKHLKWKPSSLQILANPATMSLPGYAATLDLNVDGFSYSWQVVDTLIALGIALDYRGSTETSMTHRITLARQHFRDRRSQFLVKHVALRLRAQRFYATVCRTLLWGAGGWCLTQKLADRLTRFELWAWRLMLRMPRQESYLTWVRASTRKARYLIKKFQFPPLVVQVLQLTHRRAGHVIRSDNLSLPKQAVYWRDCRHWRLWQAIGAEFDPRNSWQWRHPRSGTSAAWESQFEQVHGAEWKNLAVDRDLWRTHEYDFIRSSLQRLRVSKKMINISSLQTSVKQPMQTAFLRQLPSTSFSQFTVAHLKTWTIAGIGDSSLVVDALTGKHCCTAPGLKMVCGRTLALIRLLLQKGIRPPTGSHSFFAHVPRSSNNEADRLANEALDSECSAIDVDLHAWRTVSDLQCVALHFGFDGASRGNPGPAAAGFWISAQIAERRYTLVRGRIFLGAATNNQAEFSTAYVLLYCVAKQLGLA
eukprot:TRINITY_DN2257_c0_g1_i1.p1 TRINITY_DN2257_c0_g1~~TRINITY_DN2257_c0_g1_i1.p1  ORF type:complete len:740 (-),score=46.39 TRINITY_DN2257_c0_g1_i1:86-2305(-)